jgi:hypothetical protein
MNSQNYFSQFNYPENTYSYEEGELTGQELEQVAGGFTPVPIPSAKISLVKTELSQVQMKPCIIPNLVQVSNQLLGK